jgi:TolB-like protein
VRLRLFSSLALVAASSLWLGAISPSLLPPPRVVVFPLTVNGNAQKDAGDRLAVMFAQQLADNGVKVVPPAPETKRADFLTAARKLNCDYYVTGFITPLGAEVSVVEQVVSTASGTVIASNSAQFLTYADANGQGAVLAKAIFGHAERALASLETPVGAPTPTPRESPEASLSSFGGLFRHRAKPKPQPSPSASGEAPAVATPVPTPTATGIKLEP